MYVQPTMTFTPRLCILVSAVVIWSSALGLRGTSSRRKLPVSGSVTAVRPCLAEMTAPAEHCARVNDAADWMNPTRRDA